MNAKHLVIVVGAGPAGLAVANIMSKQGQEVVVKDGYFPITADIAKEELDHIQ